jgi:hypothetical protein
MNERPKKKNGKKWRGIDVALVCVLPHLEKDPNLANLSVFFFLKLPLFI